MIGRMGGGLEGNRWGGGGRGEGRYAEGAEVTQRTRRVRLQTILVRPIVLWHSQSRYAEMPRRTDAI